MQSIKLVFLTPIMIKLMDQGVIKNIKQIQEEFVQWFIRNTKAEKNPTGMNLLHAILPIEKSWDEGEGKHDC